MAGELLLLYQFLGRTVASKPHSGNSRRSRSPLVSSMRLWAVKPAVKVYFRVGLEGFRITRTSLVRWIQNHE